MASKLWEKSVTVDHNVETYTVGRDREMDLYLAPYDILGSMAHITMLQSINLLTENELETLLTELREIYKIAEKGDFVIEEGIVNAKILNSYACTRGNSRNKCRAGSVGKVRELTLVVVKSVYGMAVSINISREGSETIRTIPFVKIIAL